MSDPLADKCAYCGSTEVMDDAWFCDKSACWAAYMNEAQDSVRLDVLSRRNDEDPHSGGPPKLSPRVGDWGTKG